jgi:DNA-binding transcriptional regulator YhcF (GntR family)
LKLRPESLIELSSLLLTQEDELPPKLVRELKNFQKSRVTMRPLNIDWENDPRPYIRLAASIAVDIIRGELKPGDQVPSRVALARKYGVSIPTASKAVRLLARIGAAELDGNAYWVSHEIPASVIAEKAETP